MHITIFSRTLPAICGSEQGRGLQMIIHYDKNPSLNTDQKLQSLMENIQLALNELERMSQAETESESPFIWIPGKEVVFKDSLKIANGKRGYYLQDKTGLIYPGVFDNGTNLWIGTYQTASKHHEGATYISSGYSGTNGNKSIYISVPNDDNNNGSNYMVLHEGYAPTIESTVANIITPNSTNTASVRLIRFVKWGKMAQIYVAWSNKNAISVPPTGNIDNIEIGTFVSGKRPAIATVAISKGDVAGQAWYNIADTGILTLTAMEGTGTTRTIAAGTEFYISATYILP